MCRKRDFDLRTRKIYVAANLCLLASLLPIVFDLQVAVHSLFFRVLRLVLLIAAIVLFLWVLRLRKRSGRETGEQA